MFLLPVSACCVQVLTSKRSYYPYRLSTVSSLRFLSATPLLYFPVLFLFLGLRFAWQCRSGNAVTLCYLLLFSVTRLLAAPSVCFSVVSRSFLFSLLLAPCCFRCLSSPVFTNGRLVLTCRTQIMLSPVLFDCTQILLSC